MKPTAVKILDAAEGLFAEKGYDATSLGDVADRVGIRSPSLYNHFRNKEALYSAVIDRLLVKFNQPLEELFNEKINRGRVLAWLEGMVYLHHENPNFARLLQHSALSGGPQTKELIERLFRPMFEHSADLPNEDVFNLGNPDLQSWAVMALNNIVMSYITMAPMYQNMLGIDPLSDEGKARQLELIEKLARLVMGAELDGSL